MGKIRINELARELELKSNVILDYLVAIGFQGKKSHSSALDDDFAERVRAHFRAGEPAMEQAADLAPAAEPPASTVESQPATPLLDLRKFHDFKPEAPPLTRSLEKIKAAARRAVVAPPAPPPPSRPAAPPPAAAGPVSAPVDTETGGAGQRPVEKPAGSAGSGFRAARICDFLLFGFLWLIS